MELKLDKIIKILKSGEIPGSIDTKTEWMKEFSISMDHAFSVTALLIASARRENFNGDIKVWSTWCSENFGYDVQSRSHRNKCGMILIALREKYKLEYKTLFECDCEKAKSISRFVGKENIDSIKDEELAEILSFMSANDIGKMTRDEVRNAVDRSLGIQNGVCDQPELPGLWDGINTLYKNLEAKHLEQFSQNATIKDVEKSISILASLGKATFIAFNKFGYAADCDPKQMESLGKLFRQFGEYLAPEKELDKAG